MSEWSWVHLFSLFSINVYTIFYTEQESNSHHWRARLARLPHNPTIIVRALIGIELLKKCNCVNFDANLFFLSWLDGFGLFKTTCQVVWPCISYAAWWFWQISFLQKVFNC